ncbi:hypothetical protein BGZ58_007542 [Dissophora ornata]|nr:hypothetical protein BGZ58_007542 [Dissophora ornata]
MAHLLNAKEWFKRRRGKKRSTDPTPTFIPGIGYPPARNSSQPTLIPYIPPEERSSESEDDEPEYEPIPDMVSAATTTCEPATDLAAPARKLSRNSNYLAKRVQPSSEQTPHTLPQPQPQPCVRDHQAAKSPNALKPVQCKLAKLCASTEAVNFAETKAQEYARTVKTLWEMVEDEELAYRLADASPVEREWLIFNHKNAKFPLKAIVATGPTHAGRSSSESTRCRGGHNPPVHGREPRLSCIQDANEEEDMVLPGNEPSLFHHREGCPHSHAHDESDDVLLPVMMSLPNSPVTAPVDSKKARRSTFLSAVALQSATELQKRDHFTIQQRVDMEEDWRMQARLLRSVGEHQDRARGVRRVHAQLLQRQQRQRALDCQGPAHQEYEPTHKDFNKWYDLKEEIEDDAAVPDLNDNVGGYDLKEEFENEDEKKMREMKELEEKKRQELAELEHELNILGIERFEGLMSFVEPDKPRGPQELPQMTPEQLLLNHQKQQMLQQQLQHQYEQLQLQLKSHHDQTAVVETSGKVKGLQLKKNAIAPLNLVPKTSVLAVPTKVMPLRPRNGRNLFSSDCDSMIINDLPLVSAPARML